MTEIKRLIRDPYAIYARHVLRLRALDPLMQVPDALLRGIVLHKVLETFIRDTADDDTLCTPARLIETAEALLAAHVPWAEARVMWLSRLGRVAHWFVETELQRRQNAHPAALETRSEHRSRRLALPSWQRLTASTLTRQGTCIFLTTRRVNRRAKGAKVL